MDFTEQSSVSRTDPMDTTHSFRRPNHRSPIRNFSHFRSSSTVSPLVVVPPESSNITMHKTAHDITFSKKLTLTISGDHLRPLQTRLNRCDLSLGILGSVSILLSWGQNEVAYQHAVEISILHVIRSICVLNVILSWLFLYNRYNSLLKLLKMSQNVDSDSNSHIASLLFCKELRGKFIVELMIHAITPVPGLDVTLEVSQLGGIARYKLDDVLVCASLLKIYVVFRLITVFLGWKDIMSEHFCRYHNCDLNLFALRSFFRTQSFLCLCGLLGTTVVVSGLVLRVWERGYDQEPLHYLWNCIWLTVETITTGNSLHSRLRGNASPDPSRPSHRPALQSRRLHAPLPHARHSH